MGLELFEVGGCVRDEILGLRSKDIDFTAVLTVPQGVEGQGFDPYNSMVNRLELMGIKIIRDKDGEPIGREFLTARGISPRDGDLYPGRALDFVLARKERDYGDGRRPNFVEPGTLMDDLERRDFTMNAIAKDRDGNFVDPFNGRADIDARLIRAVGDPKERLTEDALRAVRAIRFALTKGFSIEGELDKVLRWDNDVLDAVAFKISDERIREELNRMFAFDTLKTLLILQKYPALTGAMFSGRLSLEATMKERKGK